MLLKGFEQVRVRAGKSVEVSFPIDDGRRIDARP